MSNWNYGTEATAQQRRPYGVTLSGRHFESRLAWIELSMVDTLGFVLIVDSTDPESFARAKQIRDVVLELQSLPHGVAANKQDLTGALSVETLRQAFGYRLGYCGAALHRKGL